MPEGFASQPPSSPTPLSQPSSTRETPAWLNGIYAGICLYFFLAAINVMGAGLKSIGPGVKNLLEQAHNPVVALMGGVIVTGIIQSSSFTTSLIITLVAAGQMDLETAIFAVMGANIGTSITNNFVAGFTMRIRDQFRRAYGAALMHGNVNLLTVAVLFPLEWATGWLTQVSMWAAGLLGLSAQQEPNSPIKAITQPVVEAFDWVAGLFTSSAQTQGKILAVMGLALLFLMLVLMVKNLKGALLRRVEGLFSSVLFRNDLMAGIVGVISTIFVQSSSVTTSLMIPLAGAGAVESKRVFPFMLGCNLGTTVTGLLAASANPAAAAVGVAICHVMFNVFGCAIWYPLRFIPIGLARWYAELAAMSKRYYFLYILVVFILIPGLGYLIVQFVP
ncbi:MAG: Na/Pi symporter [Planctomycetes bacterium]|nr:Na/Pi symporter [Planctomycetota bacterium]